MRNVEVIRNGQMLGVGERRNRETVSSGSMAAAAQVRACGWAGVSLAFPSRSGWSLMSSMCIRCGMARAVGVVRSDSAQAHAASSIPAQWAWVLGYWGTRPGQLPCRACQTEQPQPFPQRLGTSACCGYGYYLCAVLLTPPPCRSLVTSRW